MNRYKIAVVAGDGIGPEVTREAMRVLRTLGEAGGFDFHFHEMPIGGVALRTMGSPLPPAVLDACVESDAVLLGAVGGPEFDALPKDKKPETGLLQLRQALGCFANLRPAVSVPSIADCSPLKPSIVANTDILLVRELLGGLYFGEPRGRRDDPTVCVNSMVYSEAEVERVARVAFEQARRRSRKLTSVDKANVLETSAMWRQVVTRVGAEYPDVQLDHVLVDSCAMFLVTTPSRFDVIVAENLFGDILSDEMAALTGSIGLLASASIGGRVGLYEPVHGSAPTIAGQDIANPLGAIASAAMMLRYSFNLEQEARDIETAIRSVLDDGYKTADLQNGRPGRPVSTSEIGKLVEQRVAALVDHRHAYHAV
ncbi:MAG TPA: 3-isopropylmalate dehydrogenase [Candidatus Saccharimonadales bacterium]|jgi:3-isopropylmalate dehydrogenase|nr:3-isopropylmalate dehydrogenase [Candidatus Saccharimonadales bacterium]